MNTEQKKPWWHDGMIVFGEVMGWIAAPIIGALFLGKYLDEINDSDPWYFLGLTAVAFVITTVGIVKVAGKYIKQVDNQTIKSRSSKNEK